MQVFMTSVALIKKNLYFSSQCAKEENKILKKLKKLQEKF